MAERNYGQYLGTRIGRRGIALDEPDTAAAHSKLGRWGGLQGG